MHNIQIAAGQIVQQVMTDGRNLNQVLEESLRKKSVWTPAQRAALQDLSYGTLRFYGQLRSILALLLHKPMLDQRIYYVLLVALYQLQYSKAAHHAVVDHAVRSAQMLNVKVSGLVNAILRNFLRSRDALLEQAAQNEEGKYSYPQWWIDELKAQYGERAAAILEAGNRHPPMTLRVNQRRNTTAEYMMQLTQRDLSSRLVAPDALQLDKPVPVDRLPGFFDTGCRCAIRRTLAGSPRRDARAGCMCGPRWQDRTYPGAGIGGSGGRGQGCKPVAAGRGKFAAAATGRATGRRGCGRARCVVGWQTL
jgi:16S rRNA (cytosine967-C5)-methyltransferase